MTGAEVRDIRRRCGWRQVDLAERLGVHVITVSRWERDRVAIPEPTARLILMIADAERRRTTGRAARRRRT
jgi:transcriptional regulator with XRE-family HTH domain